MIAYKPIYDQHFPIDLGSYQKDKFERAMKWVTDFGVALDIGAHVGHWAHNLKGKFKEVHCFEPTPDNYECLVRNVPGVNYYPVALNEIPGRFMLYLESGSNSGSWTAFPKNQKQIVKNILVRVETLDSFNLKPDFIKMDVQDCELFILKGGVETLKRYKPVLCLESKYNRFNTDIHQLLDSINYRVADVYGKEEIFICS